MRILAINSSGRKKNTFNLIQQVLNLIPDAECETIQLNSYNIKPCLGCEHCIKNNGCVIKDDASIIIEKMKTADGIILATPVYLRNISGSLKVLIDRTCSWYHISDVIGKPILCLYSTASSGLPNVKAILDDLVCQWGGIRAGHIYRTIRTIDKIAIKHNEVSRFIKYLDPVQKKKYRPSYKEIKDYCLQKILAEKIIVKDKAIWRKRGYYTPPYYYPCKVGPIKRIYGFLFFKLLKTVIPEKPYA